eukprot:gene9014-8144_t
MSLAYSSDAFFRFVHSIAVGNRKPTGFPTWVSMMFLTPTNFVARQSPTRLPGLQLPSQ